MAIANSMDSMQLSQDRVNEQGIEILNVTGTLLDQSYVAQIWIMSNALFVWMGSDAQTPSMSSLSTAVMTPYSPMPLVTPIVGDPEMEEQQIAQRLARRSGKQCFVSCQLPDHLPELVAYVEKEIILRLTQAQYIKFS